MSRGHDRERAVKKVLEGEGWVVVRAAGSLGWIDLVAVRAFGGIIEGGLEGGAYVERAHRRAEVRFVEVKSTAGGPYERFGPADRKALAAAAERAGAEAWLAWWPSRGKLKWIPESEWP